QRRQPAAQRPQNQHHAEAGLAGAGHADDHAVGRELVRPDPHLVARALVRGGVDDAAEEEVSHASEGRRPYRGRGQAATSSRIVTTSPSATCSALRTAAFTGTM